MNLQPTILIPWVHGASDSTCRKPTAFCSEIPPGTPVGRLQGKSLSCGVYEIRRLPPSGTQAFLEVPSVSCHLWSCFAIFKPTIGLPWVFTLRAAHTRKHVAASRASDAGQGFGFGVEALGYDSFDENVIHRQ